MGRRTFANATAASLAVKAPPSHRMLQNHTTGPSSSSNRQTVQRNTDAANAAFVQTTILEATPPEYRMAIDDTLGSYITHQLKIQTDDEALVELIHEQCHVEWGTANDVIQTIIEHIKASNESAVISPIAAGNFLPNDLLDESGIEQPQQQQQQKQQTRSIPPDPEHFPPLGAAAKSKPTSSKSSIKGVPAKLAKSTNTTDQSAVANEVAAALFPPTARSRQSSIDESSRRSSSIDETSLFQTHMPQHTLQPTYHPQQSPYQQYQDYYYNTAEMLLSINAELSNEAAYAASAIAHADVNMAQYIVECVAAETPICRDYLIHQDCYRSDCPFSHTPPECHTCVFWFKSFCAKGTACRFLHGFSDRLIQSLPAQQQQQSTNQLPLHPAAAMMEQGLPVADESSSFARIAQQNYTPHSTFVDESSTNRQSSSKPKIRSIQIPPDVWNVNENRDASVFTIDDPLERYMAAQQYNHKENVMDLHYQSLKTFPVVLETLLDGMLEQHGSVWIVTGTGHHVGHRTHQKSGGALEAAVIEYLDKYEYSFRRGKDKSGQGGALLVEGYLCNDST